MTTYKLSLESGPQRRKTMVHVLDLLGCVANGPTTDAALEATPEAIRRYGALLERHGEHVDIQRFETRIIEHITEGQWLGQGSPYLVFRSDLNQLTAADVAKHVRRYQWLTEELAGWAKRQTAHRLDAAPRDGGRTARAILLHVLGTPGAYLSAALGGAPGFSRLVTRAERGELPLDAALEAVAELWTARVSGSTVAERKAVRDLSGGARVYTLRKAVRRSVEHTWEHLAELSRRPGGPSLA